MFATTFWVPTTQITCWAPNAYGANWLPEPDAMSTCPSSVTAWTLPTT